MEALEPRQLLAVVTVNTDLDVVDITQQNPTIADLPGPDALISLREAVLATNNTAGADTIDFDASPLLPLDGGTIKLAFGDGDAGDLDITESLTIDASSLPGGLTIDAQQGSANSRIFNIVGNPNPQTTEELTTIELKGLVLTGGNTINSDNKGGGAILSIYANLTVTDSVITGNDARTSGGGIYAQLYSDNTYARNLVIQNSTISANTATLDSGGGVFAKSVSSIEEPAGTITISGTTISGNTAGGTDGGGMWLKNTTNATVATDGMIEVSDSTISGNSATSEGGGLYAYVNYAYGYSTDQIQLKLRNTTISNNSAGLKGGGVRLSVNNAFAEIADSTISGNTANGSGGEGGGLYAYVSQAFSPAKLVVRSTTISGNEAELKGAGAFVCTKPAGQLEIINSTISGNRGDPTNPNALKGGGLYLATAFGRSLDATLTNVTIYDNVSGQPGDGGGLFTQNAININTELHNTIVSGNRDASGDPSNIGGKAVNATSSYNLIGTGGNGALQDGVNGNKVGSTQPGSETYDDPRLFPLGDFGGPTLTHALLPDSPAIDAGDPADQAGVDEFPLFDQRGDPFNRVEGQYVDIGAYELQGGPYSPSPFPRVIAVVVSGSISQHARYSIPDGSGEQLKTVPVGGADTITVWFDRDVDVQEAAATLTGNVTGQPVPIAPVPSGFTSGPNWGTWRFPTFSADMMELSVDATLILDAATQEMLDGDWIDNPVTIFDTASATFPSGDGTEGGDFVFDFTLLPGDANRDNVVGFSDLQIMQVNVNQPGTFGFEDGDFDGNGTVDNAVDYRDLFWASFTSVWTEWGFDFKLGDLDFDEDVDFDDIDDFVEVLNAEIDAFAAQRNVHPDTVRAAGDIDDDGDIDFDDIDDFVSILNANGDWTTVLPPSIG